MSDLPFPNVQRFLVLPVKPGNWMRMRNRAFVVFVLGAASWLLIGLVGRISEAVGAIIC